MICTCNEVHRSSELFEVQHSPWLENNIVQKLYSANDPDWHFYKIKTSNTTKGPHHLDIINKLIEWFIKRGFWGTQALLFWNYGVGEISLFEGGSMPRVGERCRSWELRFRLSWSWRTLWRSSEIKQVRPSQVEVRWTLVNFREKQPRHWSRHRLWSGRAEGQPC